MRVSGILSFVNWFCALIYYLKMFGELNLVLIFIKRTKWALVRMWISLKTIKMIQHHQRFKVCVWLLRQINWTMVNEMRLTKKRNIVLDELQIIIFFTFEYWILYHLHYIRKRKLKQFSWRRAVASNQLAFIRTSLLSYRRTKRKKKVPKMTIKKCQFIWALMRQVVAPNLKDATIRTLIGQISMPQTMIQPALQVAKRALGFDCSRRPTTGQPKNIRTQRESIRVSDTNT